MTIAVPLSGDPHPFLTLFSGLTLSSGSYFLSVFYVSGGTPDWNFEPGPLVTSDVGSTATARFRATTFAGYLPASNFLLQTDGSGFFTVTGDSSVPEPGTVALVAMGILGLALRRRR